MTLRPARILFVLALGCATPPTKDELAELDYGTCPANYQELAASEFKGGLLRGFSDELVVWPPQQYWLKGWLPGSTLRWGYLVVVRAEMTYGTQSAYMGTRLWGLLIRNGQVQETLDPPQMAMRDVDFPVGPLPVDDGWEIGSSGSDQTQLIQEWVHKGETVDAWTELFTSQTFGAEERAELGPLLEAALAEGRKRCGTVTQEIVSQSDLEMVVEGAMLDCPPPIRDEYAIEKFLLTPRAVVRAAYARKVPFDAASREAWRTKISNVRLMSTCDGKAYSARRTSSTSKTRRISTAGPAHSSTSAGDGASTIQ